MFPGKMTVEKIRKRRRDKHGGRGIVIVHEIQDDEYGNQRHTHRRQFIRKIHKTRSAFLLFELSYLS